MPYGRHWWMQERASESCPGHCPGEMPVREDSSVHRYMLSIITTHVKKSRPELETVLEKVKHLKGRVPAQ